jgi:hypothetical protein
LLHEVGDLFELNVKLRCQKVNRKNLVIMSVGYDMVARGGRVSGRCEYEGNMATVNAIGKYACVVGILGS